MSTFDPILDALAKKNDSLQSEHAQTLAKIEMNKQRYLDAMDALKHFGVSSVDEAQTRIRELENEIQRDLEKVVEELA